MILRLYSTGMRKGRERAAISAKMTRNYEIPQVGILVSKWNA